MTTDICSWLPLVDEIILNEPVDEFTGCGKP